MNPLLSLPTHRGRMNPKHLKPRYQYRKLDIRNRAAASAVDLYRRMLIRYPTR
jgi:hypothetical protein